MRPDSSVCIMGKIRDPQLPAILLIHGAGGQADSFMPLIDALEGQANIASLNMPGAGRAYGPVLEDIKEQAAYVAGFIAASGEKPWLAGHSMGSAIALQVAKDWPDSLAGLILFNPASSMPLSDKFMDRVANDVPGTMSAFLRKAYGPSAPVDWMESSIAIVCNMPPATVIGDFKACRSYDSNPYLPDIKLPVLIITGEEDGVNRPEESHKIADALGNKGKVVLLPKTGHMTPMQSPQEVAREIGSFMGLIF